MKNLSKKELKMLAQYEAKLDILKDELKSIDSDDVRRSKIEKLSSKISDLESKIEMLIRANDFRH